LGLNRRLPDAHVLLKQDRLRVRSTGHSLTVDLRLAAGERSSSRGNRLTSEHFEIRDGVELGYFPATGAQLGELSIEDEYTGWPEAFWYDPWAPASCTNDDDCQAGGSCAYSCSIGGCEMSPTSCSVTCTGAKAFPCCYCGVFPPLLPRAFCRCRQCAGTKAC
jgi:hypothetical protein